MSFSQSCRIVGIAYTLVAAAAAQPANNTCGQAQMAFTIPGAGGSVTGTYLNATADLGSSSCASTPADVYYYFTPSTTGPHVFSTCSSTMNVNTVLSIHTGCPATTSNFVGSAASSCNDNAAICGNRSQFESPVLPAGVLVIVRVARGMGGMGGGSDFTLSVTPLSGACCDTLPGECSVQSQPACSGVFQGAGTTCAPNPCPPAGACCDNATGNCTFQTQASCGSGNWLGAGGSCTPNPCIGFCCNNITGDCAIQTEASCVSGSWLGPATTCIPNPCPPAGACCNTTTDSCTFRTQLSCGSGNWLGAGGSCTPNPCTPVGACCLSGGCALLTIDYCDAAGGVAGGSSSTCSPSPCPTGACCADACCRTTIQSLCTGAWHAGATCSAGGPCPLTASADPCAPLPLPLGTPVCGDNRALGLNGYLTPCGAQPTVILANSVFYSLIAPYAGNYTFSTCDSVYQFDTVLVVFDGECSTSTPLACNDDACGTPALQSQVAGLPLAAGQQVLVLVASASGPGGGGFRLLATADVALGACCNAGSCSLTLPGACPSPAIYQGNYSTCDPSPCIGACCLPGTCAPTTTDLASCAGTWTSCTSNCACTSPSPNDACAGAIPLTLGVTHHGANCAATPDISGCQPAPLPYSVWYSFTPPANEFYLFDLCSSSVQPSLMMLTGACPGSNYDCGGSAAQPGAPCTDRSSLIVGAPLAAGVTYSLVVWSPGAVGAPTGPGDHAITVNAAPRGACCCGATCSLTGAAACIGPSRRFAGPATVCNAPGNNTMPCCRADFNKNLAISVQDIFDFLAGYFSASACTDVNQSNSSSVQDIFDFLAAYFTGCG